MGKKVWHNGIQAQLFRSCIEQKEWGLAGIEWSFFFQACKLSRSQKEVPVCSPVCLKRIQYTACVMPAACVVEFAAC